MANRINRAIELLAQDQPIYYWGGHTGAVLTYEQGKTDAKTWADYINVGMEHGAFNMAGLDDYIRGLIDGGPTRSGHRIPPVIVELPVDGTSDAIIRYNGWQIRQILARGVHGLLLCQTESPDAVRAFVESCRYPVNRLGVGKGLGTGTRGVGSEPSATVVWGVSRDEYIDKADPWPLNPAGELLLGVKIESPRAVSNVEQIMKVPGIGFAEMGPGDLSMSLGYKTIRRDPYPPEMQEAHDRVAKACRDNGIAFLSGATPDTVARVIDSGARVIAGGREDTAVAGRKHTKRSTPA
jgi:4-hydroxy-2-oxoheptanedioate aldolase